MRDCPWRVLPRTRQGGLGDLPGEVLFALGLEKCAGILQIEKVEGTPSQRHGSMRRGRRSCGRRNRSGEMMGDAAGKLSVNLVGFPGGTREMALSLSLHQRPARRRRECVHAGVPTARGNKTASLLMAPSSPVCLSPSPTLLRISSSVVFLSQNRPTLSAFWFLLLIT